ncbi:MAG: porin family protein [Bryobacterales bacterium]|nr:porin family protein [Bryobacterales bacterium]
MQPRHRQALAGVAPAWFMLTIASSVCAPFLRAEPPGRAEGVGHFGSLKFGGDEGFMGSGTAYGFTATLPFHPRWAVEADLTRGERDTYDSDGLGSSETRTLTTFHLVYRRGSERVYWFGGVGPGIQHGNIRVRGLFQNPSEPSPAVREFSETSTDFAPLGYKTGVVVSPMKRLVIRGEVHFQHALVLPDVMARVGVGFRF